MNQAIITAPASMLLTRRAPALAVVVALIVSACAAPGPDGTPSAGLGFDCNPAVAAGLGAVVGGLIGGGTNTVRGAALGAGLGALACVALNYQAQQVKTAKQVQDEYKVAHRGMLPEQSTLVRYDTSFTPNTVRPGQKAQTASYIEVAAGTRDATPTVEEELTVYKPDGTVAKTVRKPVSSTNGSGGFKGSFAIPMPEGVPQGVYPLKTALYLNGKRVGGQDGKLQVVQGPQGATVTLIALATN
ncbi:MAG: hypothetical protein H7327_10275 [Herminiimonas sp.]|nr:hypothetical protein [Herminiimonas sp.]